MSILLVLVFILDGGIYERHDERFCPGAQEARS
jgi:hypothetical protein